MNIGIMIITHGLLVYLYRRQYARAEYLQRLLNKIWYETP